MTVPPEPAALARPPRPVPLMQVVTKGWWVLRVERVSVEELQKAAQAAG
ncbi:hypothetical protein [Falsiroseomonas selenitidurans]|uniref:Uncharacterized protein n=1 Tax=Falsiroseomonas selenitidurans TaxID=2716335 RepID=A0ABX1E5T6_9PROT|nr:hypothetical protein [Falsiroseomonas selenitidurans]NKC32143.1 hypothetical protein [Falsiroseomonas selenitidurans]